MENHQGGNRDHDVSCYLIDVPTLITAAYYGFLYLRKRHADFYDVITNVS